MGYVVGLALLGLCGRGAFGYQDLVSVTKGVVEKVDAGTKTVVVKTKDGSEKTLHFADTAVTHGVKTADGGTTDAARGLKKGTMVVAHYTTDAGKDTATEFDKIGRDGMKTGKGTVSGIDRGAKTISIKTADGAEQTYELTDNAAKDAGHDMAAGTEKGAHVTVYYTEEGGKKVAHYFEKL